MEGISNWSIRRVVGVSRDLNRKLSLLRVRNNGGAEVSMVRAMARFSNAVGGTDWGGVRFYQCPLTSYIVMRIPYYTPTPIYLELEDLAWEARIENEGLSSSDIRDRRDRIKRILKERTMEKRYCGCGCGERVYGRRRWAMGHNGRVEGWFMKGVVPPGFELDYEKWRSTGCLAKLDELPISGTT